MSGCAARTPLLTVAPKSVDRVIRCCAGSTALDLRRITQSASGGPYDAGWTRSTGRRGSASAAETHAPAHGAGCWAERSACPWPRLSLLVAFGNHIRRTGLDAIAVGKLFVRSLAGAVSAKFTDRSRVATFGRLFEGTDEISLGQTSAGDPGNVDISHSSHRPAVAKKSPPGNVAERLALTQKTVSFWQCRSHNGAATRQRSEDARTGREPTECGTTVMSPDPAASPPVDNRATAAVPLHRLWITMWTVRLRSLGGPLDQLEGVPVIDS